MDIFAQISHLILSLPHIHDAQRQVEGAVTSALEANPDLPLEESLLSCRPVSNK